MPQHRLGHERNKSNGGQMSVCVICLITAFLAISLPGFVYWNYVRVVKRNHKKEQEEYMKKHPNSYGIGELRL